MSAAITGAILAGGDSQRMGRDKALLPWEEGTLLEHVHALVSPFCDEMLLVTRCGRTEALAAAAPAGCRVVSDRLEARGPLVGIQAALAEAQHDRVLVVACDMPWLSAELLRAMVQEGRGDVVIPRTEHGWEPLHAVYDKSCLPAIEAALHRGVGPVASFFDAVQVDAWTPERCRIHDPLGRSFRNVNRPEDLEES